MPSNSSHQPEHHAGLVSAFVSFLFWGITPLYWKLLTTIGATELLAHRIVWSVVFLGLLITIQREWHSIFKVLRSKRSIFAFATCGILIGVNWWIFIWAVNHDHMVDASLGYFIVPLINVLLGFLFLKERLHSLQLIAITLAGVGVVFRLWEFGEFPWIAFILATTFGLYGLIRKTAHFEAVTGLTLETAFLGIPAAIYLFYIDSLGQGSFGHASLSINILLVSAGVITAIPLIAYAYGARRISMATLGVLQFISPTCMFLFGVLLFDEPFTRSDWFSFGLIWFALLLYAVDMFYRSRTASNRAKKALQEEINTT